LYIVSSGRQKNSKPMCLMNFFNSLERKTEHLHYGVNTLMLLAQVLLQQSASSSIEEEIQDRSVQETWLTYCGCTML
jgi:hypothetical protein